MKNLILVALFALSVQFAGAAYDIAKDSASGSPVGQAISAHNQAIAQAGE